MNISNIASLNLKELQNSPWPNINQVRSQELLQSDDRKKRNKRYCEVTDAKNLSRN